MSKRYKRLPPSILLGGWEWQIQIIETWPDKEHNFGDTDPDTKVIRIDSALSIEEQWATLFHECIHAALYLGGQDEPLAEKQEEALVRCLENMLWPWLRQYVGK